MVPDGSSPENTHEVSVSPTPLSIADLDTTSRFVLPDRSNRGKPPVRYSPEVHGKQSKYPIAHYVSTHRLSNPLEALTYNVLTASIPDSVHTAFMDPNWTQAIKDEMSALQKNKTWTLVSLPEGKKTVG